MADIKFIREKYFYIFDEWANSKSRGDTNNINFLKIKLLNLIDQKDISELESYYKDVVLLKRMDNNIVQNFDSVEDVNIDLYSDFCLFKNKNGVFLTCWR